MLARDRSSRDGTKAVSVEDDWIVVHLLMWFYIVLNMCPGEKRTLTIQPEWAYGSRGMGPIPANSVLGM